MIFLFPWDMLENVFLWYFGEVWRIILGFIYGPLYVQGFDNFIVRNPCELLWAEKVTQMGKPEVRAEL
jgi:hypothetical protein